MSKVWLRYRENILDQTAYHEWLKNTRSPLPLRIVEAEDEVLPYVKLAEHIMKRHAANVISGNSVDFREAIADFIKQVQSEAYAKGIKTANKIIEL